MRAVILFSVMLVCMSFGNYLELPVSWRIVTFVAWIFFIIEDFADFSKDTKGGK